MYQQSKEPSTDPPNTVSQNIQLFVDSTDSVQEPLIFLRSIRASTVFEILTFFHIFFISLTIFRIPPVFDYWIIPVILIVLTFLIIFEMYGIRKMNDKLIKATLQLETCTWMLLTFLFAVFSTNFRDEFKLFACFYILSIFYRLYLLRKLHQWIERVNRESFLKTIPGF